VIASSGASDEPPRPPRHARPADGDLLVVGASRRDDYERVVIGRLGDSGRVLATARRLADGRGRAVPEPIRLRDP